jgi:hypothetical protein
MPPELFDDAWQVIMQFLGFKTLLKLMKTCSRVYALGEPICTRACNRWLVINVFQSSNSREILKQLYSENRVLVWTANVKKTAEILGMKGVHRESVTNVASIREGLREFCHQLRTHHMDSFEELFDVWSSDEVKLKKKFLRCITPNCKKRRLPSLLCHAHTLELLHSSDVFLYKIFELNQGRFQNQPKNLIHVPTSNEWRHNMSLMSYVPQEKLDKVVKLGFTPCSLVVAFKMIQGEDSHICCMFIVPKT